MLVAILASLVTVGARGQQNGGAAERGTSQSTGAMAADAHPSFEVATIKPAKADEPNGNIRVGEDGLTLENQTVEHLVCFAFGVHEKQVVDGPAWMGTERFDVVGKADVEGRPSLQQVQEMLQKLLESRFHLKIRRGKRELPIYAITVASGGVKLARSAEPKDALPTQFGGREGGAQLRHFKNNSMADFALGMQGYLDRPVVDETRLAGRYDFRLEWAPDDAPESVEAVAPRLFRAVEEQLGLKFKATRGPVDVLVVDLIEEPSAN